MRHHETLGVERFECSPIMWLHDMTHHGQLEVRDPDPRGCRARAWQRFQFTASNQSAASILCVFGFI